MYMYKSTCTFFLSFLALHSVPLYSVKQTLESRLRSFAMVNTKDITRRKFLPSTVSGIPLFKKELKTGHSQDSLVHTPTWNV